MAAVKEQTKAREKAIQMLYGYEITGDIFYEDAEEYAQTLVKSVLERKEEIDEIISSNLTNYTINRLNLVDLSIIRLATLEMLNGCAKQIVINEAINLTKIYSNLDDDKAKAFNNKLLDSIAKYLESK